MSEKSIIENTQKPNTFNSLVRDFKILGIKPGMSIIVHSSLSSLGWTVGGGVTIIKALQEVVTSLGTIVMPSHTTNNTDPSTWNNPSIPKDWVSEVRSSMIGYEKDITPPYFMGQSVNLFRSLPAVQRSNHPVYSFLSWGKNAEFITSHHSLDNGLGPESPLGRLYDIDAYVLLLGIGYEKNTSMHLAEHLSAKKEPSEIKTVVLEMQESVWKTIKEIGKQYESINRISKNKIGNATAKLIRHQRSIVDFTLKYLDHPI